MLLGYGCWCAFQQYLTQSYFHNRLMLIVHNRHVRCALVGIMFSATHIPNPILMIATLVAGFVFAEAFSKYRNIWPLALVQAVGGLLLAAVTPDALIHHMRVAGVLLLWDQVRVEPWGEGSKRKAVGSKQKAVGSKQQVSVRLNW